MWIHLLTLELIDGASPVQAAAEVAAEVSTGVRRPRFLRRAPKLPWEYEEVVTDDGVVIKSKRKRIPLPEILRMRREASPIPVEPYKHLPAVEITIPELGTAKLKHDEDDEDDILWMI